VESLHPLWEKCRTIATIIIAVAGVSLAVNQFALWKFYTLFPQGGIGIDHIAVMITLLGVMVTAVTLAVAVLAIWGYSGLNRIARSVAENQAQKTLGRHIDQAKKEIDNQIGNYPKVDEIVSVFNDMRLKQTELLEHLEQQNRISEQLIGLYASTQENGVDLTPPQLESDEATAAASASNGIKGNTENPEESEITKEESFQTYPNGIEKDMERDRG
jgi:hypothetical protein